MKMDPSVRKLLLGIMRNFPEVGKRMMQCARLRGGVSVSTTAMMEEFSRATAEAILQRDEATVCAHLGYVASVLAHGDDKIHEYIDVYYVEVLMFGLDKQTKRWGWALVPESLKKLHVGMWGVPDFL
jgi:hypothetical protein